MVMVVKHGYGKGGSVAMRVQHRAKRSKSFLLLFFKKEVLSLKKEGVDASFRWHDGGHYKKSWMPACAGMMGV
jgi:hypothetical protein